MRDWSVAVDNGSFDSAGITNDCQDAICEYIWNGFEAQASKVSVSIIGSTLQEAPAICIEDNGTGIDHDSLPNTFGAFLSSQKKTASIRLKSQVNKGKGRFSYTAIAGTATWSTIYADQRGMYQYTIHLDASNKANVRESDVVEVSPENHKTGTIVSVPLVSEKTESQLSFEKMRARLLEEFAWYLFLNRERQIELEYLGNVIDYNDHINGELSRQVCVTIGGYNFTIGIVVWKNCIKNSSKIYYVNNDGLVTGVENTSFNKNTVEFYHGVFVQSSYFSDIPTLINSEDDSFVEFENGQKKTMRALKKQIKALLDETLHRFLLIRADQFIEKMEKDALLPPFSDDDFGASRRRDFISVTREIYCVEPKIFHKLKPQQSKSMLGFLALLLDSNERENVLTVLEQIVALTPEQRAKFVQVLRRTKLEHIVDVMDIIQKRFDVVHQLKEIIYDKSLSRFANERDHIQKIIEQHFWLFGDQYSMVTADVTFRRSLAALEAMLDTNSDEDDGNLSPEELRQRMDIFLYGGRMNELGIKEGLVIELKAPMVTLGQKVLSQIERYANTIRKELRFSGSSRAWRFYAICSTVDDDVKARYEGYRSHGKFGLASMIGDFEIYALTWDDIFLSFEQRYHFLLEKIQSDFEQTAEDDTDERIDRQYLNEKVKRLTER